MSGTPIAEPRSFRIHCSRDTTDRSNEARWAWRPKSRWKSTLTFSRLRSFFSFRCGCSSSNLQDFLSLSMIHRVPRDRGMATRDRRINTEHKCRDRSAFFRPTNCIPFGLRHGFHANSEILELTAKVVSSGILARRQIPERGGSTELGDFPASRRIGNNSEESRWRGIKLTSGWNNFTGAFYTNEIYVSLSLSSIWTSARCFSLQLIL